MKLQRYVQTEISFTISHKIIFLYRFISKKQNFYQFVELYFMLGVFIRILVTISICSSLVYSKDT